MTISRSSIHSGKLLTVWVRQRILKPPLGSGSAGPAPMATSFPEGVFFCLGQYRHSLVSAMFELNPPPLPLRPLSLTFNAVFLPPFALMIVVPGWGVTSMRSPNLQTPVPHINWKKWGIDSIGKKLFKWK